MNLTSIENINQFREYDVVNYFKHIIEPIQGKITTRDFLRFINDNSQYEINHDLEPKLKRWKISSDDSKFSSVYLIFKNDSHIKSIVWFFNSTDLIELSDLEKLFGDYSLQNIIYDDSTEFQFKLKGLKTIRASYYGWLEKSNNGFIEKDEYGKLKKELNNPKLNNLSL